MRTAAHRSALLVVLSLALAAPAGAAEVARIDGGRLDARDDRGSGFCLRLTADDPLTGGGSSACGRAPWRPLRSSLVAMVGDDRVVVGGAVPAQVARAEAELADGRRVAFDTVPGTGYRGRHAGRLRFLLAALPRTGRSGEQGGGVVAVRFHGADGALAGIAEIGDSRTVGRTTRVLREARRGASITVTAAVERSLASTPVALDRFEELTCLTIRTRTRTQGGGQSGLCREPGPSRPALSVVPEPGCGPLRTVLAGFVGDSVTAVRLVLGSGRELRVPARTLRGAQGSQHRYVATAVPRGEAVRSIAAVGADAGYALQQAPGGLPCVDSGGGVFYAYGSEPDPDAPARAPGPDQQVAAEQDGHRLLARDAEADRLCVDMDRLLADGTDCGLPPLTADEAFAFGASGLVWAVLPTEVARVRLPDGRLVEPVQGGYSGRYRGAVRFLLAAAEPGGLRMLDSAGRSLGVLTVVMPEPVPPSAGPGRLAGGRGWRLQAARYERYTCLTLELPGEENGCEVTIPGADGAFAAAGCSPRVALLYGMLSRRTRSVRALLAGGRALRARIVRVPRRLGGGRAFVLALPRAARVKALRFDGRRFTFPLLPAADQCGYRVFEPYLSPPLIVRR